MEENKRKLQRRHIRSYMGVYSTEDQAELGQLLDITCDGILVIAGEPIEPGWQQSLRIMLTIELDGADRIPVEARCVWCEPDINPRFYAVGFELLDPDSRSCELIDLLIDQYGLRTPEPWEVEDDG